MRRWLAAIIGGALLLTPARGFAEYGRVPMSDFDPAILKIDEKKYLGVPVNSEYLFFNGAGEEFLLKDWMEKPVILALSYFSCDGVCASLNRELKEALAKIHLLPGKDYRVLTVSFDKNDGPVSLRMFQKELALPEGLRAAWRLALLKDPESIQRLTESLGYRFFWSKRDRIFLHPNVLVFLSPGGRVTRYLYTAGMRPKDLELALLDASRDKTGKSNVQGISNLLFLACYSYNFKDGKYTINYPLFIGAASFLFGIALVILTTLVMYRKKKGALT